MELIPFSPNCHICGQRKKSVFGNTGKEYFLPHEPSDCTPPVENSNPSGASEGADGQGVCIKPRSVFPGDARFVLAKGAGPGIWNEWQTNCGRSRQFWSRVAPQYRVVS